MKNEITQRLDTIRRGETPDGYKKTGVGIIPNNWTTRALSDVINNLQAGVSVNSNARNDTGYYVLKTSAISNGKVKLEEAKPVVDCDVKRLKCPVEQGCIMISRMNTPALVGACGYVNQSSQHVFLPDRLWLARNAIPDRCSFVWLNYLLNSARYKTAIQSLATGTSNSMKNISKQALLELTICFLPIKEQQKIVEILAVQDKVIELKEKRITEKQRQKKYLMQQLLTGKKRLKGFSGEWITQELGAMFSERIEKNCEDLQLLAITGTKGVVPRTELDLKDNSSEDKSKYLRICAGDIGYNTMRMWQGVSAYSNYEGIVSPAYTILKPKNSVDAKYFAYLFKLQEIVFLFYRFSQGLVDDTRNLKYSNLKKIHVSYPIDINEQSAIVEVLSTSDNEILLLQKDLEQEKLKKKALMQLLLTGIVRVSA
ncbi:restriction endonuclease subunit S [Cloacibacillus sp.]|uniref:restriction endonuclease subunit S n=1 Tax=Cloacibacillus sp. TaxID=2049023 RepID=UPI0025BB2F58|nr:restriction endonuclease subunit S [Cloacibacillus sp.]MCC8058455.1 restriction endonuclease subunit S [Cloacibacillus sp.]